MGKKIVNSGFQDWNPSQLPNLSGKTYVITGGNSGIGLEAARILGNSGANLVLACRSPEKAEASKRELELQIEGNIDVVKLDLSSLASLRSAAEEVRSRYNKIDGLINNAGIMQTPERKSEDGFELQFATNHLGHFLWTSLLIDRVEAASGRVVVVSSIAHKFGSIYGLEDLMADYSPSKAYSRSKLANLMFALELDRRLKENGCKTVAIACHPGYSETSLQSTGPTGLINLTYKLLNPLMAQSPSAGAIPTVLAAAGKEAKRGAYYGPQKLGESRGPVSDAIVADHALNQDDSQNLWSASENFIGEQFNLPG